MSNFFLGAMLVVAPFFIKLAPQMSPMGSWSFYLKIVAVLAACVYGVKPTFKVVTTCLIVLLAAFTAKSPFTEQSWYQLDYFLFGLLLYASLASHKLDEKTINRSMSVVCLLSCGWIWLNYIGIDLTLEWLNLVSSAKSQILKPLSYPVNGSLGHINHSLILIVATAPFLNKKLFIVPVVTLATFGTALPVACAVFGALFYYWRKTENSAVIYSLAGLVSILSLAVISGVFPDASFLGSNGRVDAWTHIIKWTWSHLFGQGYGAMGDYFTLIYKTSSGEKFYHAHSEIIESYVIGGIPMLLAFIFMAKSIFNKNDFIPASTCCFILLINSLGNFTFQVAPLLIMFLTCYTLITFQGEKNGSYNNKRQ